MENVKEEMAVLIPTGMTAKFDEPWGFKPYGVRMEKEQIRVERVHKKTGEKLAWNVKGNRGTFNSRDLRGDYLIVFVRDMKEANRLLEMSFTDEEGSFILNDRKYAMQEIGKKGFTFL